MCECKIAEKLVELRAQKGVTQGEVAKSLMISDKTLSKWEKGASMPDLPMLIALSKYYGISTDSLLGLTEEKGQGIIGEVCSSFRGLDRKTAVRRAFETAIALVPAMCDAFRCCEHSRLCTADDLPVSPPTDERYRIAMPDMFELVSNSEDVNLAVMLMRNRSDFAWLRDPSKQKEIAKLFWLLSDTDVLSVLYFLHSVDCSESFTVDYVSQNTRVKTARVEQILDTLCTVNVCQCLTAHLLEGEIKVYESYGDGLLLSLLSLAYEKMCGKNRYAYSFYRNSKMIGGN